MDLKEEKERGRHMRGKEHSRWGTASAKSLRGEVPDEHKEGREAGDGGDAAGNWTMLAAAKKRWCIHTVGHCSARKRRKLGHLCRSGWTRIRYAE